MQPQPSTNKKAVVYHEELAPGLGYQDIYRDGSPLHPDPDSEFTKKFAIIHYETLTFLRTTVHSSSVSFFHSGSRTRKFKG